MIDAFGVSKGLPSALRGAKPLEQLSAYAPVRQRQGISYANAKMTLKAQGKARAKRVATTGENAPLREDLPALRNAWKAKYVAIHPGRRAGQIGREGGADTRIKRIRSKRMALQRRIDRNKAKPYVYDGPKGLV